VRVRSQFPTTEPIEKGNILVKASTEEEAFKKVMNYRKSPKLYTEISHIRELTPRTSLMKIFITVCIAILAFLALNKYAESRAVALMDIGACVDEMVALDGFTGTAQESWELYAESCK
jgi:hypothetical protein